VIYLVAFLVGLDFVGIDLTTLTVFSGAVGIGLGFGLQKIASNFISGLILLMEKSIEEGDLIELSDGTFGYIRRASARYTLVETFDSKEILVPNEDLITSRVVNWTFSNSSARIEIELGVAYDSDIDLAHDLILAAAREHPRCAIKPEPACFLRFFGDSSVNFILHFWVEDVTLGRWPTQSEVMFSIWRKFKDNGIEIPFPQRDLHIKGPLNFNRSGEATPSKEE
ncbi:MAG: mechanosensitive ion channel, partial [Gammaproteobacteria bacterium]|nr:mechanosensitive ion channel [Gammaproteobacteria bacterium]